jgi:hypothetical protein
VSAASTDRAGPGAVTIVGGGVSSLLLGVELLRAGRPVILVTADSPERAGGHLASWSERGYPVEHGFHALFDFYAATRSLLSPLGLLHNFVQGPPYFFIYRGGQLARMYNDARVLMPPLSPRERLDTFTGMRSGLQTVVRLARGDDALLASLDQEEFRSALLRRGAGPRFARSPIVQMFYDFGFHGETPLSAAVGFATMTKLFQGGRMHHFAGPSRPTLIDPLRRRFLAMGGKLRERTTLDAVRLDPSGRRARALRLLDDRGAHDEPVEELVLALDLESTRQLSWLDGPAPSFLDGVQRLSGAVSLSLQAWFEHDPVPAHIDSVLGGLPEPWSTVCPVTRVRRLGPGPHGHELIACGPEVGFAHESDEALSARFLDSMRSLGMKIPRDPSRMHLVLRRNRAPRERYLLTRPGELSLRPLPGRTEIENLCLVGAWLRNAFPTPSVEAASLSVLATRDALLSPRTPSHAPSLRPEPAASTVISPPSAMPSVGRGASTSAREQVAAGLGAPPWSSSHELCPEPPYRHEGTVRLFMVSVDPGALAARRPPGLAFAPGFSSRIALFLTDYDAAYALRDPTGARFTAREVMMAAVVIEPGAMRPPGLFPFVLYIDSDVALAVGREVYGFQKRLGAIEIGPTQASLTRDGLAPGARGAVAPIRLLHGTWSRGEPSLDQPLDLRDGRDFASRSELDALSRAMPQRKALSALGALSVEAMAMLVDGLGGVALYNQASSRSTPGLAAPLLRSTLLRVPARDVSLGPPARLQSARFELAPSMTDPLSALLPAGQDALLAPSGLEFRLGFTIDEASEVAPPQDHAAPPNGHGRGASFQRQAIGGWQSR